MVEEPQGQSGLDGEIRVAPLPTPPAAPAGRPGSDRFRGQPHRHIATSNEGPVVGRPVRHAIFRLVCGMDLRLHPCSVAPAAGHEKCGPNRPTPAGSSCNNARRRRQRLPRLCVRRTRRPPNPVLHVRKPPCGGCCRLITSSSGRPSDGSRLRMRRCRTGRIARGSRCRNAFYHEVSGGRGCEGGDLCLR